MTSLALLIALIPGVALACPGGMGAGGQGCASGGSGMIGAALLAVVAALGWGVLRYASKEAGTVKTAGQVIGWILAVGGIAGFLCGAACHAASRMRSASSCDHHAAQWGPASDAPSSDALPPGHPPLGEKARKP